MTKRQLFIVVLVLIGSLLLRFHNYTTYPQRGATSDEYSYSFLGVSLLTKGIPISWSPFWPYKHRSDLTIKGIYFPIVYPYFDHPPFNGLVVGAWALLHGENSFEKIQLSTIRIMPILFSFISSVLLFLIAQRHFGYKTALWALLIYTTTTIFVMNGRVVLAENLLTPIYLGAVYMYGLVSKKLSNRRVILLGVLSGLSFLTKELGVTVVLALSILFLYDKVKPKYVLLLLFTFGLFVVSYIVYGAYYDFGVFWKIIGMQSGREVGPETLYYILSTPIIVNKVYYDGWYFLGFLSFAFSLMDYKKNKYIIVPAVSYLFLLLFFLTERGEMGWYIIPLFPFMAMAAARLLLLAVEQYHWLLYLPVLLLGNYYITELFQKNFGLVSGQYRVFLLVLFIPLLCIDRFGTQKTFEKYGTFSFYFFIACNAYLTFTYVHPA